ncbi:hypothetical protein [Glaciecola sp. 33A]|jgi:hypothetical protein|uniref:hypothetical protein n=1 Tax=Glaciecola sp. 33A TaxID=2057807 RepID=UPI000C343FDB|nr:hypothetical protein [Glaciecola sp. 33A]PKI02516.1 hypothetical protein CXF81_06145 [Glaciecola sp. 33A]
MLIRIIVVLFTIFFCSSCRGSVEFKTVPIFELLSTDEYSQSIVMTSGYLTPTPDGFFIYPYEHDALSRDFTREIMVIINTEFSKNFNKNCKKGMVLIKGTFFESGELTGGFKQISNIESIVMLSRRPNSLERVDCLKRSE